MIIGSIGAVDGFLIIESTWPTVPHVVISTPHYVPPPWSGTRGSLWNAWDWAPPRTAETYVGRTIISEKPKKNWRWYNSFRKHFEPVREPSLTVVIKPIRRAQALSNPTQVRRHKRKAWMVAMRE